ncbi:ubiquitin activating enzyme [Trypanosoma cruzi]|uniref:Ubiquitin activating enzyme, putative n=2 Tax=Trypanosoma cruzi TaxID=5693 RepID=Q4DF39_TRYCC|nr:ubiquitin activating enzyme, putative [Trypanosoma cruzi]EAN91146.1 ubiquitin activating enzyme, putative [Trypanosoma cruzi]RNC41861.1 ubiquitin activating enzyme [Trypanosoma cruzi]|eukprot:XP_812997.1 ubiquitin activating enzyme [Trypanosoma cruzi strain CL Brener]
MNTEERIRYDRQVRLWGKATQQQLQQTAVRICGMTPAVAEVVKNLVLAGVCSVTVEDEAVLDDNDLKNNFLIQGHAVGERRGRASVGRLQSLNPYVAVHLSSPMGGEGIVRNGALFSVLIVGVQSLGDAVRSICLQRNAGTDLVVLVSSLGHLTMSIFLSRKLEISYEEQVLTLLTKNVSSRPVNFQRTLLLMRMSDCPEELPFFDRLAFAMEIVVRYNLLQLAREDVEFAASFSPRRHFGTAIEATVAGGTIAQHIIREISCVKEGPGDESYTWILCDNRNGTDIQVGHTYGL